MLSVRFCLLFLNPTCCPLQPTSRCLTSILGKSNLQFAGMTISLTISTSSLNLLASDCKQVRLKRVDPPPTEDDSAKQAHSDLGCRQSSAVLNIGKSFSAAELKKKVMCLSNAHLRNVTSQDAQGLFQRPAQVCATGCSKNKQKKKSTFVVITPPANQRQKL